jgi:hypothetical protein
MDAANLYLSSITPNKNKAVEPKKKANRLSLL